MVGSIATTAVITNGLHCGPACKGIITTTFSLYCDVTAPPVVPPTPGGGGGPYPRDAWNKISNVNDFYTPTKEQFYEVPRDKEADYFRKQLTVTLKVSLGDIKVEKTYSVPEKRKNATVKFFNILNATQSRMNAQISKLKTVINRAKVTIRNIRVRNNNG